MARSTARRAAATKAPMRLLFAALIVLLLPGCPADPAVDGGVDVPSALDAPVADDAGSDAPADDVPGDAPADDAPAPDDAPTDAPVELDGGEVDASAPACEYTALDEVLVRCGGEYTFVSRVGVFPPDPRRCPEYYVVGARPTHYASTEEAIAAEACDDSCVWRRARAVSRIFCEHRSGYEVLSATGCADLYLFDDGFYPSVDAYDSTHPCTP